MNAMQDNISHAIDVSNWLDSDSNFQKIHLIIHWGEKIHPYGALQQDSAERYQQSHKMKLKDIWNASNHNLNYLP